MQKLIECVPNFSEGKDMTIIQAIANAIKAVSGVSLLDIDPGISTNRTVVTFVGDPDSVIEAAFQAIKTAAQLIDMRKHKGEHPRMGATDVCPLVPISNVTKEEAIEYAHKLAKRVGEELNIPVYLYEFAAQSSQRQNLADIRAGEYEGFKEKILLPEWKPDYGAAVYNETAGQTVIGARDFLVAYNVNLNTKSVKRANAIAFDIREKGRGKTLSGEPVLDENGEQIRIPGNCKFVKAIGWYVAEYGIAQVSANLTNIVETPVHVVFDAAVKSAFDRGLRVTGSELVGLIPKKCLTDAGKYFLEKQQLSAGQSEEELIHIAVKSLGLADLKPFNPHEKIIEYKLETSNSALTDLTIKDFVNLTASDAPAPGGGSIAALAGALGASLGAMVANLSIGRKGLEDKWKFYSDWAVVGQGLKERLLFYINEDTNAFNKVMEAFRLPKNTPEEKVARKQAIQQANKYATQIPFQVIQTAFEAYPLLETMIKEGNPNSITDAGVGALCIHTAIEGAALNVLINIGSIEDEAFTSHLKKEVASIRELSTQRKQAILDFVEGKIAVS